MERELELRKLIETILDYSEDREVQTREFAESVKDAPIDSALLDRIETFLKETTEQQEAAQRAFEQLRDISGV